MANDDLPVAVQTRPYVGPRSFESTDHDIFFGRDFDSARLFSLVVAHELLLLYGESGAGKTSLLNAGLIPLLEKEGFTVLRIARVAGILSEEHRPRNANLYVFNTLASWAGPDARPQKLARQTLCNYLGIPVRPAPQGRHWRQKSLDQQTPRVAIFDQFEEFFAVHPDQPTHRADFFKQLRDALENDQVFRVILVMREDRIAHIDTFSTLMPNSVRIRFRLPRLDKTGALAAITGPLAKRNTGRSFAPKIAEKLVEDLLRTRELTEGGAYEEVTGEFVEPVQLQVVCETLWDSLSPLPRDALITEEHLKNIGNVDDALAGFYDRSVATATEKAGIKEATLRRWFESELITSAGTRGTIFRGADKTGGIPNSAVDLLVDVHLIREEWRAGARWCELTHDRFIEPIQRSNEKWRFRHSQTEPIRKKLAAQAAAWIERGRNPEELLDDIELFAAERWLAGSDAADVEVDGIVGEFVQASRARWEQRQELAVAEARAEEKARVAGRMKALAAVLAVACIAAAGFAVQFGSARRKAEDNYNALQGEIAQRKEAEQFAQQRTEQLAALLLEKHGPYPFADPRLASHYALGIDVAHFDGDVDWRKVKASGVAFGYAKASDGANFVDDKFGEYWRGMKQAGLLRGAYHFFRPALRVDLQTDNFLAMIRRNDAGELPAAVDLQIISAPTDEWSETPKENRVPLVMDWLQSIEKATGRRPIIISTPKFIRETLGDANPLAAYPLWITYSSNEAEPPVVAPWITWTFWQFTFRGRVSGVRAPVANLSWFNGSEKELALFSAGGLKAR